MIDYSGWEVKEVHYFKNSVKFVLARKFSPDKELELSLVKFNGVPQLILTEDHIIVWRSGSLP